LSFVALAAVVLVPVAQAAPKGVTGFFGNPEGTNNSKLAGEFGPNSPLGVAVNSTGAGAGDVGDVYVADRGNHRVQRFDADGGFVSMWGRDVVKPNPEIDVDLGDVFEVCSLLVGL
jgi:DNA-binding beta-propeller fold protein YncE